MCPKVSEIMYLRRPPSSKRPLHCVSLKKQEFLQIPSCFHPALPAPNTYFGKNVLSSEMLSPLFFSA